MSLFYVFFIIKIIKDFSHYFLIKSSKESIQLKNLQHTNAFLLYPFLFFFLNKNVKIFNYLKFYIC